MRMLLFIVTVMLMMPAWADYAEESNQIKQKYDTDTADEIMELTNLQRKIIQDEADDIESQIEQINPDIVAKNKDRPAEERIAIYRNYLAREAYEYYKQYFKNQIERRSVETGRAVRTQAAPDDGYGTNEDTWLDRGELDEPKCAVTKNGTQPCPYPNGFEEISLHESGDELFYMEDDKAKNRTYWATVMLINDLDVEKDANHTDIEQDISLSTYYTEFDYTKYRTHEEADRAYDHWLLSKSDKEQKRIGKQSAKGKTITDVPSKTQSDGIRYVTGKTTTFTSSHSSHKKDDK